MSSRVRAMAVWLARESDGAAPQGGGSAGGFSLFTARAALFAADGDARGRRARPVWHPQAKTKCPRLEFSNEMQMDYGLSQV